LAEIVVADAGPLIAFGRLDKLSLLGAIFERVIVPQAVYAETLLRPDVPDAVAIRAAVANGSLSVEASLPERADLPVEVEVELGDGEAAAIALAAKFACGVLIDDSQGRAVAAALKLKVIGSVGVLVIARERGLIPALAPLLEALRSSGYYLSERLIQTALERVGEA
jgi:predicted nucleic acid-binding protein